MALTVGGLSFAAPTPGAMLNVSTEASYANSVAASNSGTKPGSAAVGQSNKVTTTYGSSSVYGNENTVNGSDSNAYGDENTVFGLKEGDKLVELNSDGSIKKDASGNPVYTTITAGGASATGNSMAYGDYNSVHGQQSNAYGTHNTIGSDAAGASYAGAYGTRNTVSGDHALAAGDRNTASGLYSTVVGQDSTATEEGALALGRSANATGRGAVALGQYTKASNTNAVAEGNNAEAKGDSAVAIGNSSYADQNNSMAIGNASKAEKDSAIALGNTAKASGNQSVAIGNTSEASADNAVALGNSAKAAEKDATALGNNTKATGENSTAVGNSAIAGGINSEAIGTGTATSGMFSTVNGAYSKVGKMGTDGTYTAGSSFQGATASVYGTMNTVDTAGGNFDGVANSIVGTVNTTKNANGSLVFGAGNSVSNSYGDVDSQTISRAAALYQQGKIEEAKQFLAGAVASSGGAALVIGGANTVDGASLSQVVGVSNRLAGTESTKTKQNLLNGYKNTGSNVSNVSVIGSSNTVSDGSFDIVIGDNHKLTGASNTVVLGSSDNGQETTVSDAVLIGHNAKAAQKGDVALGADSETAVAVATTSASINGETKNFAGTAPVATVSVGAAGKERTITNVAAGRVSASSTDAINGSQLFGVVDEVNKGVKYAGDVQDTSSTANAFTQRLGAQTNIVGGVTNTANLTDNNIGVVSNGKDTLTVKLKKNIDLGTDGSVKMGDTIVNNDGVTITGGPSITKAGGINAGDKQVTHVASGGDVETNGANIGDVKNAVNNATTNITNSLTEKGFGLKAEDGQNVHKKLGEDVEVVGDGKNISTKVEEGKVKVVLKDDININSVTAKTINGDTIKAGDTTITTDGMTITGGPSITKNGINAGGKQIAHVASGGDVETNGANIGDITRIVNANKTILKDGKNTTVEGDGSAANPYKVNVNDNINLGKAGANGKDGSLGVNGKDGFSVTINGKDGSIGMAGKDGKDGLIMKAGKGKDGVDGKNGADGMTRIIYTDDKNQPHEVATLDDGLKFAGNTGSVAKKLNETMTIKGTGTKTDSEYDSFNIKTMVNNDGDMIIGLDKNLKADTMTVGGKDGKDGSMGVKGKDGKDGVTISSVGKDGSNGTDGHIGIKGKDGASADIHVVKGANGVDGTDGYNGTDGIDRIVYEDHNGNTQTVATMNDGMKYGGDTGDIINKKLNEQVNVVGGITDTDKLTTEDNLGVVSDGSSNLKVRLAKDLKGLNSVTATTINGDTIKAGNTVTINHQGADMGGTKVTNLRDGDISAASKDAVNGSQLYKTNEQVAANTQNINNIGGAVNNLDKRVDRVGAGAAALAALHPLDFDPDDKWDVAAGYGNYKDADAVAIGAFYRPNEDTMFSVGGSFGGGENMVNAGVSVKLGQGNHVSTSRVAMAKEIKDLKKDVAALKVVVNQQSALIDKLTGVNAGELSGSDDLFPDVPANHWAYEYVTRLKQAGILTGYPDGNFAGDRMMTRYEFAAIVYRAIMAGAAANPSLNKDGTLDRLAKEFSGEMKYIRIDTIRKDRNGKPTIQRVRVIKEDENKA